MLELPESVLLFGATLVDVWRVPAAYNYSVHSEHHKRCLLRSGGFPVEDQRWASRFHGLPARGEPGSLDRRRSGWGRPIPHSRTVLGTVLSRGRMFWHPTKRKSLSGTMPAIAYRASVYVRVAAPATPQSFQGRRESKVTMLGLEIATSRLFSVDGNTEDAKKKRENWRFGRV